jgi:hypothetical protein
MSTCRESPGGANDRGWSEIARYAACLVTPERLTQESLFADIGLVLLTQYGGAGRIPGKCLAVFETDFPAPRLPLNSGLLRNFVGQLFARTAEFARVRRTQGTLEQGMVIAHIKDGLRSAVGLCARTRDRQ